MFLHVFKTWALANLIHPVTILLYVFIDEDRWGITMDDAGYVLIFFFFSLIISIPSLVIARIFIYPIIYLNLSPYEKLILWIIAVFVAIIVNYYGFLLIVTGGGLDIIESLYFLVPAVAAGLLATLLRIKAFLFLESEYKSIKT